MISPEVPPTAQRLKYYFLALAPSERYRTWVEGDIASLGSELRHTAHVFIGFLIGALLSSLWTDRPLTSLFLGAAIGSTIVALLHSFGPLRRRSQRKRMEGCERRWLKQREKALGASRPTPS